MDYPEVDTLLQGYCGNYDWFTTASIASARNDSASRLCCLAKSPWSFYEVIFGNDPAKVEWYGTDPLSLLHNRQYITLRSGIRVEPGLPSDNW